MRTDREHPGRLAAAFVLGFVALSLGDHQTAVSHLDRLTEAIAAFGLGEPGVVKFLPDQIEALAALGQVNRAWSFARQLEEWGNSLGRLWALATACPRRAHLAGGDADLQRAQAACEQALSFHETLPMPFELGRTLLVKGIIERRDRRKSAARDAWTYFPEAWREISYRAGRAVSLHIGKHSDRSDACRRIGPALSS